MRNLRIDEFRKRDTGLVFYHLLYTKQQFSSLIFSLNISYNKKRTKVKP